MRKARLEKTKEANDKALRNYQLWCLSLFLPSLLSFLGSIAGLAMHPSSYALSFSSGRALFLYLNALTGNQNGAYKALGLAMSFLLMVPFGYFSLQAAKGKRWAIILGISLYLADLLYGLLSFIPSFPYAYSIGEGTLSLIIHLLFLSLSITSLVKYAKLSRLLEEETEGGPKNGRNGN